MNKETKKLERKAAFWVKLDTKLSPFVRGSLKAHLKYRVYTANKTYKSHLEKVEMEYRRRRAEVLRKARVSLKASEIIQYVEVR